MLRIILVFILSLGYSFASASTKVELGPATFDARTFSESNGKVSLNLRICFQSFKINDDSYKRNCARLKIDKKQKQTQHIIFESKNTTFKFQTSDSESWNGRRNYKMWLRLVATDDSSNFGRFLDYRSYNSRAIIGSICKSIQDVEWLRRNGTMAVEKKFGRGVEQLILDKLDTDRALLEFSKIAKRCVRTVGSKKVGSIEISKPKLVNQQVCGLNFATALLAKKTYLKAVQSGLKERGLYAGSIDGVMGKRSCKGFQKFLQCEATGVTDFSFTELSKLSNAPSVTAKSCYVPKPKCGMSKALIVRAQQHLTTLQIYSSKVDGLQGPSMNKSIQKAHQLILKRYQDEDSNCLSEKEVEWLGVEALAFKNSVSCFPSNTVPQLTKVSSFLPNFRLATEVDGVLGPQVVNDILKLELAAEQGQQTNLFRNVFKANCHLDEDEINYLEKINEFKISKTLSARAKQEFDLKLKDKENKISKLGEALVTAQIKLYEVQAEKSKLKNKFSELKQLLAKLQAKTSEANLLKGSLLEKENQISDSTKKLVALGETIARLEAQNRALKVSENTEQTNLYMLESKLQKTEDLTSNLKKEIAGLKNSESFLKDIAADLKNNIITLKEEKLSLKSTILVHQQDLLEAREKIKSIEDKTLSLENDKSILNSNLTGLKASYDKNLKVIAKLRDELTYLEVAIDTLETENLILKDKKDNLLAANEKVKIKSLMSGGLGGNELTDELDIKPVNDHKLKINRLNTNSISQKLLEGLKNQNKELILDNELLKQNTILLNKEIQQAQNLVKKVKTETKNLKTTIDNLTNQNAQYLNELETANQHKFMLSKKLKDLSDYKLKNEKMLTQEINNSSRVVSDLFNDKVALIISIQDSKSDAENYLKNLIKNLELNPSDDTFDVFLSRNASFSITLGLGSREQCNQMRKQLVAFKSIPEESYCGEFDDYVAAFDFNNDTLVPSIGRNFFHNNFNNGPITKKDRVFSELPKSELNLKKNSDEAVSERSKENTGLPPVRKSEDLRSNADDSQKDNAEKIPRDLKIDQKETTQNTERFDQFYSELRELISVNSYYGYLNTKPLLSENIDVLVGKSCSNAWDFLRNTTVSEENFSVKGVLVYKNEVKRVVEYKKGFYAYFGFEAPESIESEVKSYKTSNTTGLVEEILYVKGGKVVWKPEIDNFNKINSEFFWDKKMALELGNDPVLESQFLCFEP